MESDTNKPPPLHTERLLRRTVANRVFAVAYSCSLLALLSHHAFSLLHSTSFLSFFISISMLVADTLLGFMWSTTQAFRMRPIIREEFPQNLGKVMRRNEFPAIDIFICTADPYKEPPLSVVNTALSVMAYDYPAEKISVYVSDDGGSELTLFAFMEAAKFASCWLPFCRENSIMDRCPDVFFRSNYQEYSQTHGEIKRAYERMKGRVENVVKRGSVPQDYMPDNEKDRQAFSQWSQLHFSPHQHPSIIQVLLESGKDKDDSGHSMPNLIYLARQKSKTSPHHFKAGALNALLRISAVMTNAPMILTLDCDMYSNDPQTPHRLLCCYLTDPLVQPNLAYVQFPQRFHGLNEADIYASEFKRLYQINPVGMNGLLGPCYVGSGCFFRRRCFFGRPSSFVSPDIPNLSPYNVVDKPMKAQPIMELAHHVAGCNFEDQTSWGSKMGFRYGSLSEDFNTGYWLHCEGWISFFSHPKRPAFLGDAPITLNDALSQTKRWSIGLLEVAFSKYSPLTFGSRHMDPLMAHCYSHNAFWPIWSIPITIYAFLPQLALLSRVSIFPKVTDGCWFYLYVFLFLGAYVQDCVDFILAQGTFERWWSDQRMWLARGLSSFLFGLIEHTIKHLGIQATRGFNVTSKVVDDEQSKRYDQGTFEFGAASPMFVPLAIAAIINLLAVLEGLKDVYKKGRIVDGLVLQMFIAGFGVLNCLPIYEGMFLRNDKGRMPTKITLISTLVAATLYAAVSLL